MTEQKISDADKKRVQDVRDAFSKRFDEKLGEADHNVKMTKRWLWVAFGMLIVWAVLVVARMITGNTAFLLAGMFVCITQWTILLVPVTYWQTKSKQSMAYLDGMDDTLDLLKKI